MKHLFINEDYSRLICYLGFNEPCMAYWNEGNFVLLPSSFMINTNEVWLASDDNVVTAPTIAQAHGFFESYFGLYGSVRPSSKVIGEFEYVLLNDKGQTVSVSTFPTQSHEDCYKQLLKRMCDEASKVKEKRTRELV